MYISYAYKYFVRWTIYEKTDKVRFEIRVKLGLCATDKKEN
jgi:hypothetical protein